MRGSLRSNLSLNILLLGIASLPFAAPASEIVTNWVAFNDHRPGPLIPPHVSVRTNWGTALRVTTYDMGAPADSSGTLTNFLTGEQLPVTVTFARTGSPDDFGTISNFGPATNTPAAQLFYGICDLSNSGIVGVDAVDGDVVTITINNLNPDKRYAFRGTSARGGGYAQRWTVATLTGANGWIDANVSGPGSLGVITSNDFPASLVAGQVAWNSGDNVEGDVVGWDFIAPAPDGSFSIVCAQYVGPYVGGTATDASYGYSFGAMMLAEVEASVPVVTTNPPPETTVEQNRPFRLSVAASGTPLLYQWYKEGLGAIPGATFATYSVSQATLGDSGDYYAVVYNPLASATSTIARVTVNADVTPPSVLSAYAYPTFDPVSQATTLDQVMVEFNEAVLNASDSANYLVSGDNIPSFVTVVSDRTVILHLPTALAEDTDYTVQVTDVTDLVNNSVNNGGTNNPAPFHTWARSPGNGLLFEAFNTGGGVDVVALTSSPVYPDQPYLRTNLWAFDTRVVFPDDTVENYGSRTRGVFIPPVSGNWLFFLRTYDRGEVYLNPNGLDPAGAVRILAETTGNEPRDWNKFISSPFALQGGQAYYIEALQKAQTGTDVIKVAARLAGTDVPTLGVPITELDTNALAGPFIAFPLAPRDLGGPLTLVQDVEDVTAEENHEAMFEVVVSNPSSLPMLYQWSVNGVDVPGANGPTYTIPRVTMTDEGIRVRVRVLKVGSALESREALLSIVADVALPTVVSVHSTFQMNQVRVRFSEAMRSDPGASIPDPVNFRIDDGTAFTVQSAVVEANGIDILLTLDQPLAIGGVYALTVEGIQDLAGNGNASTTVPLLAWVLSRGFAMEHLFFDIGAGTAITDLTGNAKYPNSPDQISYKTTLEGPTDSYDSYGVRLFGWLKPTLSGAHVFYMCSDDNGSFRLSPDNDPANLAEVAREISYAAARTWVGTNANNDRGDPPVNVSSNTLAAGNLYAFELLAKEGSGSDNAGAAWQVPDGPLPVNGTPGIPGAFLYSLADPVGASVTITQQPVGAVVTTFPSTITLTVGASSMVLCQPNANLAYAWQKDSGTGFEDLLGAYGPSLTIVLGPSDVGGAYRCLVFAPGASATSAAAEIVVPQLSIMQDGTKVTVAWPAAVSVAGLVLQRTAGLPAASWITVPSGEYQTSGGMQFIEVTLPPGEPNQFYRLFKE